MRPIDPSNPLPPARPKNRPSQPPSDDKEPQDGVQLSRTRTASGRFRVKRGDTKLKTLRETYGLDFAAGLPGNMPLAILRAASGLSLSQMLEQPEKLEEATQKVKKEKTLVRLYQDSPGAGGGYPPESAVDTDSPGAGGGYPPYQTIDSPGAGGGYPPAETVDSPGAGGGYPPYQSVPPGKEPSREPSKEPPAEPQKGPSDPPRSPA